MSARLALIALVCFGLPLQQPANAQPVHLPRLVNDWCYPFPTEWGWEHMCRISVFEGTTATFVANGYSPSWSPDGLRIAFTDGFAVYILDRTDDTVVRVTGSSPEGEPFIFAVRWSPDGTRIAYVSAPAGAAEARLMVVDADGSHPVRLSLRIALSDAWSSAYAWMPSGAAIAFGGYDSGSAELYRIDVDGSDLVRLTNGAGFRGGISWSADAARIAFNCGTTICAVDADGTNLSALTKSIFQFAHTAIFSPSSGAIAFLAYEPGFPGNLFVQASDGTILRIAPDDWIAHPRWSPDGGSLAFVKEGSSGSGACNADGSPCGSPDQTFVANADGTGLTTIGGGHHPEWFVPPPGSPVATFTSQCTGAACQFSAAGSFDPDGSIASYQWTFGDGTTGSGPAPAHTYATGATYDVRLIVTDNDGARDMARTGVTANAPPVASFSVSCAGPTCTFAGSGSTDADGTIVRYEWAFGDGTYASGQNAPLPITHVYRTGTFTATLQVWDNAGASSVVRSHTLTTTNAPPVAAFTVTCTELLCAYDASASSNPDDAFVSFQWHFGEWPTAFGRTATHAYAAPGTYTVTLTVLDTAGQQSSASQTINVVGYMHVGDLDGRAEVVLKNWEAVVTLTLHAGNHGLAAGVVVRGSWNDGIMSSCTTDSVGQCLFIRVAIPRKAHTLTFTVTGAADGKRIYTPAGNHDPDGDSTGSRITIRRQ
jgi:Tol biopolymer transport system component/PKD repeat protein